MSTPKKPASSQARRKLLKLAAGGGAAASITAIPKQWSRPVVDSILIPAHAQTTDDTGTSSNSNTTTPAPAPQKLRVFSGQTMISSLVGANSQPGNSVLDMFVNTANAGKIIREPNITINIRAAETPTPGMYNFRVLFVEMTFCQTKANGRYVGYVAGPASGGNASFSSSACPGTEMANTFSTSFGFSATNSGLSINGTFFGSLPFDLMLTEGDFFPAIPPCVDCPPV